MPAKPRTKPAPEAASDQKGRMFQGRFYSRETVKAWGKKPHGTKQKPTSAEDETGE